MAQRADDEKASPFRAMATERRLATRNMDELIGLCEGVLADAEVNESEARFILRWLEAHRDACDTWPGNVLYDRIARVLSDGKYDLDEQRELLEVLGKVAGGPPETGALTASGAIPFNDPAPAIDHVGQAFCLTGVFVFGKRRLVEEAISGRGGVIAAAPSGKTNFLIVGTFGSEEWLHSTHGRKIIRAIELRDGGAPIAIVTEKHWTECFERTAVAS